MFAPVRSAVPSISWSFAPGAVARWPLACAARWKLPASFVATGGLGTVVGLAGFGGGRWRGEQRVERAEVGQVHVEVTL